MSTPNPLYDKRIEDECREFRADHFDVKFEPNRWTRVADEFLLCITVDGVNWNNVSIMRHEIPAVIAALRTKL